MITVANEGYKDFFLEKSLFIRLTVSNTQIMIITAELGDDMKKLQLFTVLFAFMATGAHADDLKYVESASRLMIKEIHLSNDPTICGQKWRVIVTNTGDASSPRDLVVSPSIVYGQDDDQVYESQMADQVIDPIAPEKSREVIGQVVSLFAHVKDLVISIKDGEKVIGAKSVRLPDNTDYSIVLGDAVYKDGEFTVPIANKGSASASSLIVVIRGLTGAKSRSTFKIKEDTITCVSAGEVSAMSIIEAKQKHVGYRVQVYRMGGADLLATRDYLK